MERRLALAALLIVAASLPCAAGQPAPAGAAENSLEAITQRLAATRMESVEVEKQDAEKVLDLIRDAAKVNIVVEAEARHALEGKTVTLKLKGVTALSVLQHVLRQVDLGSTYDDEALVITTPDANQPHPQITIYDIRDMTQAPKGSRLPPTMFGSQLDPLYYYWIRNGLAPVAGAGNARDPFWQMDLLDTLPGDPIGDIIARTVQERFKGTGVTVNYYDGYLVVVEQPKAARVPVLPPKPEAPRETPPPTM